MPYSYPKNIPSAVKNLPEGAQKLYISAYNGAESDGADQEQCRQAGWANVKRKYEKVNNKWVKKTKKEKSESTTLVLEVSGFNQWDNKEYSISLKGNGVHNVSLNFKSEPPEFLTKIGTKILITISDGKDDLISPEVDEQQMLAEAEETLLKYMNKGK